MDSSSLYNLAPMFEIVVLGAAIAAVPLGWTWLRKRHAGPAQWLAAVTVLTLYLTFDLVLVGAFTRLTDSGLGCPDWPGCYGTSSPVGAVAQISAEQARMPTGPVTHTKAWIEMVHRYLATATGALVAALAGATWLLRKRGLPVSPLWPTITLIGFCLQGAFGALTVTMKLFPAIVTMHLLGALILLALLSVQAVTYRQAERGAGPVAIPPLLRRWLVAGYALLWLQVALGGWVSTNYAVLACSSFPTCQGSWWPAMDFAQGFEFWRALGKTGAGEHVTFAALTAIHYAHRLMAYAVFLVLGALAWQLRNTALRNAARWIAVLLAAQLLTGLSNVVLGWPLVGAVAHTGGAAGLVVALTFALRESRGPDSRSDPSKAAHLIAEGVR
jgi:cytochrome c oxidase assembly protein subunit 15